MAPKAPIGAAHMMKPTTLKIAWARRSMAATAGRPFSPRAVRAKANSSETSNTCSTSPCPKAEMKVVGMMWRKKSGIDCWCAWAT